MAKGGARPGAGAPKNAHRIHVGELRKAMEETLGISYVQLLAETQQKLFNDFKQDKNVKEFIVFTENMSKRILTNPDNEDTNDAIKSLTKEDLKAKIDNYLTRVALSNPIDTVPTEIKDNQP